LERQASVKLQVRLNTSDGVLMWLGSQSSLSSSWLPLVTLDVVDGRPLLTWYSSDDDDVVALTAWNGRRIDDNRWHHVRAHRYVVNPSALQWNSQQFYV